jgi:hypothetical protein
MTFAVIRADHTTDGLKVECRARAAWEPYIEAVLATQGEGPKDLAPVITSVARRGVQHAPLQPLSALARPRLFNAHFSRWPPLPRLVKDFEAHCVLERNRVLDQHAYLLFRRAAVGARPALGRIDRKIRPALAAVQTSRTAHARESVTSYNATPLMASSSGLNARIG